MYFKVYLLQIMKDFDISQEKFDYIIALFSESSLIILLSFLQI